MIQGETVTVQARIFGRRDPYGNEIKEYEQPVKVAGVLCGRRTQRDEYEGGRPYAFSETFTFCFPKSYKGDLRGALITRDQGDVYEVVGDPTRYTEANLPGLVPYNIKVEAVRRDG